MKEVNKGILDNDMVISVENIQKIGEVIALTCIKTVIVRSGKDLHYLFKGLLRDINRSKDDYSPFSNAYVTVIKASPAVFSLAFSIRLAAINLSLIYPLSKSYRL